MDIAGSVDFTVASHSINPGLSSSFPWLANLANNYEFYHFKRLEFHYRPYVGTQSYGSLILAADYDAADSPATSKARMMSYMGSVMGPVYKDLVLKCSSSNLSKFGVQKFTRGSDIAANKDIKTYDVLNLMVGTDNGTVAKVGSLFVSYEVELMTPHTPDAFPWEDSAKIAATSIDKAKPLLAATFASGDAQDPVVTHYDDSSFLISKAGQYLINFIATGTSLTATTLTSILSNTTVPATFLPAMVNAAQNSYIAEAILQTASDHLLTSVLIPAGWAALAGVTIRITPYKAAMG